MLLAENGKEMKTQQHVARYSRMDRHGAFVYEVTVPSSFADVGAVVVENRFSSEVFVSDIELRHGGEPSIVTFSCNSWVTCHDDYNKRIFFPLKVRVRVRAQIIIYHIIT